MANRRDPREMARRNSTANPGNSAQPSSCITKPQVGSGSLNLKCCDLLLSPLKLPCFTSQFKPDKAKTHWSDSTSLVCVCNTVLLEFPNHQQEFPNLPTPMEGAPLMRESKRLHIIVQKLTYNWCCYWNHKLESPGVDRAWFSSM